MVCEPNAKLIAESLRLVCGTVRRIEEARVTLPALASTVTVYVPAGVLVAALKVTVEVAVKPPDTVSELEERVAVTPGALEVSVARFTVPE